VDQDLRRVWNQTSIPVVLRRTGEGEKLRVRLPYGASNKAWLRGSHRMRPQWVAAGRYWELPKAWFNDFVDNALPRFGRLYVIQPYREEERCSPSCLRAEGHECECSCMGANHGIGNDRSWFEITERFAARFGPKRLACRLMVRTRDNPRPRRT